MCLHNWVSTTSTVIRIPFFGNTNESPTFDLIFEIFGHDRMDWQAEMLFMVQMAGNIKK